MLKKYRIVVNGEVYEVEVEEVGAHTPQRTSAPLSAPAQVMAPPRTVVAAPVAPLAVKTAPQKSAAPKVTGTGVVASPMPGTILGVKVKVGDAVKYGQPVVILEAMKMENEIVATMDGTVREVRVNKGTAVNSGDVLVVIG